jgi:hypothetical protein
MAWSIFIVSHDGLQCDANQFALIYFIWFLEILLSYVYSVDAVVARGLKRKRKHRFDRHDDVHVSFGELPRGARTIKYCGSTLSAPTLPVTSASRNAFSASMPVSTGFKDLPLASFLSRIKFMRAITPSSLSLREKERERERWIYSNTAYRYSIFLWHRDSSYFCSSSRRTW